MSRPKILVILLTLACSSLSFVGGYFVCKNKVQKKADSEIRKTREMFNKEYQKLVQECESLKGNPLPKPNGEKPDQDNNQHAGDKPRFTPQDQQKFVDYGAQYRTPDTHKEKEAPNGDQKKLEPYVISPEDFQSSDYEAHTLIYYKDGILADDDYNVISNPNVIIGKDALTSFGRYNDDDSVYVCDDQKHIIYEIIRDNRTYKGTAPYPLSGQVHEEGKDDPDDGPKEDDGEDYQDEK
jgi:hypothetical protein